MTTKSLEELAQQKYGKRMDDISVIQRRAFIEGAISQEYLSKTPLRHDNKPYLVVFKRETNPVEVVPFDDFFLAFEHYDKLQANWDEVFFCKVIDPYVALSPILP